jgi:hypothetical protein
MPGITLEQAQAALDASMAAHLAILEGGTTYRRGDRWVECPPLEQVMSSISLWQAEVQRLSQGIASRGVRIYGITPG